MEQTKIKLGPLQTKWIKFLRNNLDKQGKGFLGKKTSAGEEMCCLGAAGLIAGVCHWNNNGELIAGKMENARLYLSGDTYEAMGLRSPSGRYLDGNNDQSLSYLNDENMTWPEIAALLEENPNEYFTKSI